MKTFTPQEQSDRKYMLSCIEQFKKGMLGPFNTRLVQLLIAELERLQKGDFTEEEFQNLCHNFNEDDAERHKQGCIEYHKLLFSKNWEE